MGNNLSYKKRLLKSQSQSTISSTSSSSSSSTKKSSTNTLNNEWFRYEQGRRFHNFETEEAKYCLPNDVNEQERLQLQHYLMRYAWKGNYSSPVRHLLTATPKSPEDTCRVLDVGCGPGTWILEMATDYPNAYFIGVDMSAIFPTEIHPKNVEFIQANVIKGLPWPDEYFDFVYQRFMIMSYTVEQWDYAIKELLRVTKRGGWLEIFDGSTYVGTNTSYAKILDGLHKSSEKLGINSRILPKLPGMVSAQNQLEQVFVERTDIPLGSWGGRLGELAAENLAIGMENIKIPVSKYWGISHEEYDKILATAIAEFKTTKGMSYGGRIYGRKKMT